ncbi:MAG: hypothetical protein ABI912_02380 [Actinomycetota bacterium]
MQRRLRTISLSAAALSAAIFLSACGNDYKSSDTKAGNAGSTSAVAGAASSPAASAGAVKLATVTDAKLGDVVADGTGFTLYRFDKDSAKPPTSNCSSDCATTWPPVIATGKPAITGVDAVLVGTVKRADGTEQVTLNGWPIYRFSGDTAAGQTNGQGIGKLWYAVTPTGGKAGAGAAASPTSRYSKPGY